MRENLKTYCFDLDETLCHSTNKEYHKATPIKKMISKLNHLYNKGHKIIIFTARGMGRFNKDVDKVIETYKDLTLSHLKEWGVNYHELIFGKPSYDMIIDDKCLYIEDFQSLVSPTIGFICGSFDIIHPGYIHMFKEIKSQCDVLLVGLHVDPTTERPEKIKPILSVEDRKNILNSIRYVDKIHTYETEKDLINLIKNSNIDIRFLGEDYRGKDYTGIELDIKIRYIDRDHKWSTTKLKTAARN